MKVLFIMLIVVLLVAFAVPVFADKGGEANENANFGQIHKLLAAGGSGSVSDMMHLCQEIAEEDYGMNLGQLIKEVIKPFLQSE